MMSLSVNSHVNVNVSLAFDGKPTVNYTPPPHMSILDMYENYFRYVWKLL